MNKRISFILVCSVFLGGCGSAPQKPPIKKITPVYPEEVDKIVERNDGSLFIDGAGVNLFNEKSSHQVGDVVTVNLKEQFNANKVDKSKFQKQNNQDFGVSTPLNFLGRSADQISPELGTLGIGYGSKGSFSGNSDIKQNSSMNGSISVIVVKVFKNGNLAVQGEKRLRMHDGDEVIQLTGLVRPEDINPDNTIDSTKIANINVVYHDNGFSGDTNRPGALTQWLNKYWPL